MSSAKPSMGTARVQPNSKASARQLYAWSIHPDELKPLATDEPNKCQHGKARSFSLTLGDKYPECSGNLVVYVPDCCKCERKLDTLTQPNPEQREAFRSKLKAYDEAAKTPKSTPPKTRSQTKAAMESSTTTTRARIKATPTASPSKRITKDLATPRKKAKLQLGNRSPAASSPTKASTIPKEKDIRVCLFFEANQDPIVVNDRVPDVERYEFTQHKAFKFSNAGNTFDNAGKPTVYVRYSPHLGDFKDVPGSRVFAQTNISESGDTIIYRAEHLKDADCPGLEKLKFEVHMMSNSGSSHYPSFPANEPVAGPSTLKRKRNHE